MKLFVLLPILALSQDLFSTVYNITQKLLNRELELSDQLQSEITSKIHKELYRINKYPYQRQRIAMVRLAAFLSHVELLGSRGTPLVETRAALLHNFHHYD